MAEYPIPPYPAERGFKVTPVWNTIVTSFDAATEQRKNKKLFATYDVSLVYPEGVLSADVQTLWAFYMARKGAYGAFYIYDLASMSHVGLFVGWGDGSTATFDIPGKSTSSQKIYVDGTEKTVVTQYDIVVGGGTEASDRVTFTAGNIPTLGQLITCDLTGYMRIRAHFKDDRLTREHFLDAVYVGMSIELTGLSPEGI